jgi:hypothetical protein
MNPFIVLFVLLFSSFQLVANTNEADVYLNNIQSTLPQKYFERFQRAVKSTPLQDGPNCFQSTAYISGLTNRTSYMSDIEFFLLLKKFNCQKITRNEAIKAGDIGLLSSDFSSEFRTQHFEHAFIWDKFPDYLIEKIGSYSSFKLKQTHIKESENWTLFKKECIAEPDKCPLKITNYRCPQYLAEKPWSGSAKLESQRRLIEGWVHSSDNPTSEDISKIIIELKIILADFEKEKKENSLEKEEAISLLRQVQIFQDPN